MSRLGLMFSGQGAQYPGMMKDIYDNYEEARNVFSIADKVLNRSITEICFNGSEEELNLTHNTQPCLLTVEIALWEVMKSKGIMADAVAGFSLGEYSALVAAGVFSFEDAVDIVQYRADVMQNAVPVGDGAMGAVKKATPEIVEELCRVSDGYVVPANYNSPGQIVVSGENDAVDDLIEKALKMGVIVMKLPVSAPFHCKLMEPAVSKLNVRFKDVRFHDATIPVYMNVDGEPETKAERIKEKLLKQTMSPVLWNQSVDRMYQDGIDSFVEIGPGKTLFVFAKKILKSKEVTLSKIENNKEFCLFISN